MQTVSDTITISDPSTVTSVAVTVNITDVNIHGLTLTLVAPDGTRETLRAQISGPDDLTETYIWYFDRLPIAGDWELRIHDRFSYTNGILHDWALTFIPHDAPSPVTSISGSGDTYHVTVPAMQDGSYNIDLSLNHVITDIAGNILFDMVPTIGTDETYVVTGITDIIPPVISSIERSNPTAQNTNRQSLTYKVTFSEAVTGVDAFDFVFSPDSTGGGNSDSYPVTSISGSGDTYYATVPVTTDGTYNLDLVPSGHGIADAVSIPLTDTIPTTGIDHTYVSISGRDNTRPTVSSIDRYDPAIQDTDSKTLTYKVTFSEDVIGVDKADFNISPSSTGEVLDIFPPANQISYNNSPYLSLPNSRTTSDTITVSDFGTATSISVAVDISHNWLSNLKVDLIAPDGTTRTLHNNTGGYADDIISTYEPDFNGVPITGNWTLEAYNRYSSQTARLNGWTLIINQGSPYPVASLSGSGDTYYATVLATRNGTYNLDLVSSGHGIADTAGNALTDTAIAVGTARISANGIVGGGDVQINGLPGDIPWVFATVGGQQVRSGLTSSSGSITMPLPDYSMEGVTGEFSLLVYEDGFGHNVQPGNLVADLLNGEFIRHDFGNPAQNIIYIPERYMLYPITVPVTIDDVRLGKLTTDCNVTDQVRLRYLDGSYDVGSAMYVPFIPGMSALKMSVSGAPVCVKFADVLPPVQIVTFEGDTATGKNAPVIDIVADATASAILATNDLTSLVVSFGASGFSEHDRYVQPHGVMLTGESGTSMTCEYVIINARLTLVPPNCPDAAQDLVSDTRYIRYEIATALQNSYTKYEVVIDVFKNGQFYDTVTLSLNSLVPVAPADLWGKYGFFNCDERDDRIDVSYSTNRTTVTGGHHYYQPGCSWGSNTGAGIFQAITGSAWSEVVSHTFDIDGSVGDHIEVQISNRVIFNFPYPYGNYHPYNTEGVHHDWPSTFETEIINGDDFLGPDYDRLEYIVQADYGPNDRGVAVTINDGTLMLVSTR